MDTRPLPASPDTSSQNDVGRALPLGERPANREVRRAQSFCWASIAVSAIVLMMS